MIKKLSLLVLLLSCYLSFSQIDYEKGYLIDNSGKRTECFIKNYDWKNNPTTIEYKLSNDSNALEGTLKEVAEFGVDNFSKYVRANVDVDRASIDLNNYDFSRIPNYKPEILFLKVIKEGNVVLYSYEEGNLNLYFIRAKEGKIEQLVNKPYKIDNLQTGFYQYFRQQLLNAFEDCKDIKEAVEKTKYNKTGLESVFVKYYQCSGQTVAEINKNKPKSDFNLSIRPGIAMNSFAYEGDSFTGSDVDFGNKSSVRLGVELEVVLPFNKGKWALLAEPNYKAVSFSKTVPTYGEVTADIKTINVSLGVRHYMFLNTKSKLFLNLVYNVNVSNSSTGGYQFALDEFDINQGDNFSAGLGYKYKKYSAELRFDLSGKYATSYEFVEAKTNTIAFILGYTFF